MLEAELASVVTDQEAQIQALREAFGCFSSPEALAQCLARFDSLRAGEKPLAAPGAQVPAEEPHNWL